MMLSPFFSDAQLSKAAFDLLTSSTLERYRRLASRAVEEFGTLEMIKRSPERIRELEARARTLWRTLLGVQQRDTPEVELALLLSALAKTGSREVDRLLRNFSLADTASVTWVGALARSLWKERPWNEKRSMFEGAEQEGRLEVATPQSEDSWAFLKMPDVILRSSPGSASVRAVFPRAA